jgi:hypothetical protein
MALSKENVNKSMKNEIDQFFREKFEHDGGERFQYKEAYWDAVEALIEADKSQYRRKRMLWWYSAGLLLLLASGVTASMYLINSSVTETESDASELKVNQMQTNTFIHRPSSEETTGPTNPENQFVSLPEHQIRTQNGLVARKNKMTDGATAEKSVEKQKQSKVSDVVAVQTMAVPVKTKLNNGRPSMQDRPADLSVSTGAKPQFTVDAQETAVALPESVSSVAMALPVAEEQVLGVLPLPDDMPLATSGILPVIAASLTKPVQRTPSLFTGVMANVSLYSRADRHTGWAAYAFAQKHLRGGWAVQASVGLRLRQLNYNTTGSSVTDPSVAFRQDITTFGFGFERLQTTGTIRNMLAFEVPLSVQYHRRRWSVEAGLIAGRLQRLYLEQTQFKSTSLNADLTKVGTRNVVVFATSSALSQWYTSPFVGAAWQITPSLSLNTRLSYYRLSLNLSDILPSTGSTAPAPGTAGSVENGSMDIGLVFTLNKKK